MQRAQTTKSFHVNSKHVVIDIHIRALLYFTLDMAPSTFFFRRHCRL